MKIIQEYNEYLKKIEKLKLNQELEDKTLEPTPENINKLKRFLKID